jgi:hypothetical protein
MPTDNKKIEDTLKKAKRNYEDLFERVLKENVPNTADLERISEGMQTASILSSNKYPKTNAPTISKLFLFFW